MRKKRFVVIDGEALEHLELVYGFAHVVERAILALLQRALERNAVAIRDVPRKVCIESKENVDQRLWTI